MSNLESIVPTLELCKQIPEGCFEDSALVFATIWADRTPFVVSREEAEENGMDIIYPAPTLAEIMQELPTEKDGYFLELLDCRNVKKAFQIGYARLVEGNFVSHPYFKEKR